MKILYLTDQLFLHGGVEKVLSQKANFFADCDGHDVTIVTTNQNQKPLCYPFSSKIKFIDLSVNYEIAKSYFSPENLFKIPKHFKKLNHIIKVTNPDIIIMVNYAPDYFFLPFFKRRIPKIKEFHSSRFFSSQSKGIVNILSSFVEKKYDALVVLNPDEKKFYQNNTVEIIPNSSEISNLSAGVHQKRILAAGRIAPVKNFEEIIEAFSRLCHKFPDWELHFYGENYLKTQEELQNKINSSNLQQQIKFMGKTPNLKETMQQYSIYAMTSHTECFPMVLLEALSIGMPIVTYDSPTGPKHIVRNLEDSFLVEYKNLNKFVDSLEKLMKDEELRISMGKKAKENIKRFDSLLVMKQWNALFQRLKN